MIEHFATTVLNSGLLEQLAAVLEKRCRNGMDDPTLLARLGDVYRQLGLLDKAAAVYTRLTCLRPEDAKVRYLRALLAGDVPPARPASGSQPVPFVFYRDCLPMESREALFPLVLQSQAEFEFSAVNVGEESELQLGHSTSLTLAGPKEINRLFRGLVKASLPQVLPRLQMESFKIECIQVDIRAYRDGHFFRPHQDHSAWNRRRINFSYFLHRRPRPFTGGDLVLYDTDFANCDYDPKCFTRIVPEDNCMIFYPSAAFHEATAVHCPGDDFADSRFAIIGAVSTANPGAGLNE